MQQIKSTIFGCIVASNGNVLIVPTIMTTPAIVTAVANEIFWAEAAQIVQPYATVSETKTVCCRPANATAVIKSYSIFHFSIRRASHINR